MFYLNALGDLSCGGAPSWFSKSIGEEDICTKVLLRSCLSVGSTKDDLSKEPPLHST
ncbi:hypothetical protein RUM43_005729 [Polyplax serrata]|uniref:Uncharacterized protein n=1 Tax=Polyplax serrata TaxID=468196 RepID=A0AAN8PXF5_POLSC